MSNTNLAHGQCLCKAVSLSTTNFNQHISACHCNMCRTWGGGAALAVECGSEVQFSGTEHITIYQSSPWADRGFCKICGTHLFYRFRQNQQYYIPAGLFEDQESFILSTQIFIEEKPKYYSFANPTHNMTGAEVFAEFSQEISDSDE